MGNSTSNSLHESKANQPVEATAVSTPAGTASRYSFWSKHKTLINFWLDVGLLILLLIQAWCLTIVALVFPRNDLHSTIWGGTAADWLDTLFAVFCVFGVAATLHVMLHWSWICGTISTRLLGRKAGKDDGTQTLIGVGFLILLLHGLGAAILAAKVSLVLAQ
ncbi:hypothetical protein GC163_23890 [bacterium]|nr:hypothetical protein [bacterium]